jgi:hypothetical protein
VDRTQRLARFTPSWASPKCRRVSPQPGERGHSGCRLTVPIPIRGDNRSGPELWCLLAFSDNAPGAEVSGGSRGGFIGCMLDSRRAPVCPVPVVGASGPRRRGVLPSVASPAAQEVVGKLWSEPVEYQLSRTSKLSAARHLCLSRQATSRQAQSEAPPSRRTGLPRPDRLEPRPEAPSRARRLQAACTAYRALA